MTPDISIIIVNYNSRDLLHNCLASIKANLTLPYEVIVADNASADGSVEKCAEFFRGDRTEGDTAASGAGYAGDAGCGQFIFIPMGENAGFAKANNRAAASAKGRILHFLNPDTEIPSGMNADYATVLKDPDTVYVNPLVNRDGSIENDKMPVPNLSNLIRNDFRCKNTKYWYRGASVIISAENFRKIGLWCEDYFLYSEDLELFWQIETHGLCVKSLPTEIFHLGGGCSSNTMDDLRREVMVQKSTRIFFRRNFPHGYGLSRAYLLLHTLIKRPKDVPTFIKAWRASAGA